MSSCTNKISICGGNLQSCSHFLANKVNTLRFQSLSLSHHTSIITCRERSRLLKGVSKNLKKKTSVSFIKADLIVTEMASELYWATLDSWQLLLQAFKCYGHQGAPCCITWDTVLPSGLSDHLMPIASLQKSPPMPDNLLGPDIQNIHTSASNTGLFHCGNQQTCL